MRFSVVIPLYNKAAYIEEAVRSVVNQDLPAEEIIVVDDGSTDAGPAKVIALNLPGVRLLRQPNGGAAAARNAGIEVARGDYICFLDADDSYRPGFLAAIARLAERYPEAELLATSYVCRHADGHLSAVRLYGAATNGGLIRDFYAAWNRSCFFCAGSLAIRRNILADQRFRFPVGERLGEDQDLWFRIAEHFPIAFDPVAHAEYRVEVPDSATYGACVRDELPAFRRLRERLLQGEVPTHLQRSAGRVYSRHVLNVANSRLTHGDWRGAWAMVKRKEALANPLCWLRTAWRLTWLYGTRKRGAA